MRVLQRFLFPSLELRPETDLYLKAEKGAVYSNVLGEVRLPHSGVVSFDTYFNSFSAGKWRRHTDVRRVTFAVEGVGSFEVHAVLNHPYRSPRVVTGALFDLAERTEVVLPTIDLDDLGDGQLYLKVQCLQGEATIFGAHVATPDPPKRDVRLGIVITTFNRKRYVNENVDRLALALKRVTRYRDRIEVLIVDNACNLDLSVPADVPIRVIPNRNLGGAGGFARGLIAFRDSGAVSHVLFMDDDISFEPEVIFRTVELLSSANDPNLCLAGAMLMEEHPHIQFEAGATFDTEAIHPFRPLSAQLDLRKPRNLVLNDVERRTGYGGWWFFAFPLVAAGDVNPLPVFVRGDDVLFGLKHVGAHTITVNGIGVWHQHFDRKNGPTAMFYEARNLTLVSLLASDRYGVRHLLRRFIYLTGRMLLTFKYDTANAYVEGLKAFLRGPATWMTTDHEALNDAIRTQFGERIGELAPNELAIPMYKPRLWITPRAGGLLSAALLSGHAFPKSLNRRHPVALKLDASSPISALFRENLLYRYDATGEGFVANRDRKRFFALLREMVAVSAVVPFRFRKLKAEYRAAYAEMTSDDYWRRQFSTAIARESPEPIA